MSRATLYVRFPDGSLRYGLYDGTSDVAWPRLYSTPREAWDTYYSDGWEDFTDYEGEPVQVATDYGAGHWWTGTATHEFLTSGHDTDDLPDGADIGAPLPDWAIYPPADPQL